MPCRSDYLEPNRREKEGTRLRYLLDEMQTGEHADPGKLSGGMHPLVYNKSVSQEVIDKWTSELCDACAIVERQGTIGERSLELQIWWRDHKEWDKRRVKEELRAVKNDLERREALAKLTDHEWRLLGL